MLLRAGVRSLQCGSVSLTTLLTPQPPHLEQSKTQLKNIIRWLACTTRSPRPKAHFPAISLSLLGGTNALHFPSSRRLLICELLGMQKRPHPLQKYLCSCCLMLCPCSCIFGRKAVTVTYFLGILTELTSNIPL